MSGLLLLRVAFAIPQGDATQFATGEELRQRRTLTLSPSEASGMPSAAGATAGRGGCCAKVNALRELLPYPSLRDRCAVPKYDDRTAECTCQVFIVRFAPSLCFGVLRVDN